MLEASATRLEARLGKHMRAVRGGEHVVVTDRSQRVARIVPYTETEGSGRSLIAKPRDPAMPPLGQIRVAAIAYRGPDTAELLSQDRARR